MTAEVPLGLPHRGQIMATFALLAFLLELLLAQLTLVFAVLFLIVGRAARWRGSWLMAPAAAGLVWGLVAGPGHAIAGFAAGPAQVLAYFGHGHELGRLGHPLAGFRGAGGWLPRQLPVALVAGAAEAAVIGWRYRPRAGEPALPPRPGPVAWLRGALTARMIRAGAVLTRSGCALGVVHDTGAVAELRWAEIAGGALVTGPVATEVTVTCLQVVHAALRRRKPLIVIDPGNDAAIGRAVAAACAATGTPLARGRDAGGFAVTDSPGAGVDLVRVISERSAVLLPGGAPRLGDQACAEIAALAAELRRIGVDGDALVWVPAGESPHGQALTALIRDGGTAGLPVLISATSPATGTELAGSLGAVLTLAARTSSRMLTHATRSSSTKPWHFSLAVESPRHRQVPLARLVPAKLPSAVPARQPHALPERLPHAAATADRR